MKSELSISLTPRADGSVVFRCIRADGSTTWQCHQGPRARFFPFHDLGHYAVETVLGARDGFYGLIAAGWDIEDTGGKGARGALPAEAVLVEQLVGLFERDGMGGAASFTATDLRTHLDVVGVARFFSDVILSEESVVSIRQERERLFSRWVNTPNGETMELTFTRPAESRLSQRSGVIT